MRDAARFRLLGYGGNASPFPLKCAPHAYPPRYAQYAPSLLRVERVASLELANLNLQLGQGALSASCGLWDTGFTGTSYDPAGFSVLLDTGPNETAAELIVPPLVWPVLYARGLNTNAHTHGVM